MQWRKAAFLYAKKIQPSLAKLPEVHDALQLSACGENRPTAPPASRTQHPTTPLPTTGHTMFVAPAGSDSAAGTEAAPLASVHAAVDKLRELGGAGNTVVLRTGTYYMSKTLESGPTEVNLTLQAYPGEEPWLSGAVKIEPTWTKVKNPGTPIVWNQYNSTNAVFGLQCPAPNSFKFCPPAKLLGVVTTANACEALCSSSAFLLLFLLFLFCTLPRSKIQRIIGASFVYHPWSSYLMNSVGMVLLLDANIGSATSK